MQKSAILKKIGRPEGFNLPYHPKELRPYLLTIFNALDRLSADKITYVPSLTNSVHPRFPNYGCCKVIQCLVDIFIRVIFESINVKVICVSTVSKILLQLTDRSDCFRPGFPSGKQSIPIAPKTVGAFNMPPLAYQSTPIFVMDGCTREN